MWNNEKQKQQSHVLRCVCNHKYTIFMRWKYEGPNRNRIQELRIFESCSAFQFSWAKSPLFFSFFFSFFGFWGGGVWRQRASHLLRLPSGGIWDDSPATQIGQSGSATSITDDEWCESYVQSHVTISLISFIWNWYLRKESLLILDINRRLLRLTVNICWILCSYWNYYLVYMDKNLMRSWVFIEPWINGY